MEKKVYNKLVRDGIPAMIEQRGGKVVTHIADDTEFGTKVLEKLSEEALEAAQTVTREELIKELADLEETKLSVLKHFKITDAEIEEARLKKLTERGGFDQRIILEESEQVEKL